MDDCPGEVVCDPADRTRTVCAAPDRMADMTCPDVGEFACTPTCTTAQLLLGACNALHGGVGDCEGDVCSPGLGEACNGVDDDCDGRVDEQVECPAGVGLRFGIPGFALTAALTDLRLEGQRPADVQSVGGDWFGLRVASPGASWTPIADVDAADLRAQAGDLRGAGKRPYAITGWIAPDGSSRFAALFEVAEGPAWELDVDLDPDAWRQRAGERADQGWRPVSEVVLEHGGETRFTTLWEQVDSAWDRSDVVPAELEAQNGRNEQAGLRLVSLTARAGAQGPRLTGVWHPAPDDGAVVRVRVDLDAAQLADANAEAAAEGAPLIALVGWRGPVGRLYAAAWRFTAR